MFWKLFRSDYKVAQALAQSGRGEDISPGAYNFASNNNARPVGVKSRLWLEDWSEQDEARLRRNDHHWEGYTG